MPLSRTPALTRVMASGAQASRRSTSESKGISGQAGATSAGRLMRMSAMPVARAPRLERPVAAPVTARRRKAPAAAARAPHEACPVPSSAA